MSIDELEQQVLGQARSSFERSDEDASSALSLMQRRLAAAPLAGLVGLDLPPLPDVSGAFVATQNAAVVHGAASVQSVSTAAQVAAVSQGSTIATAATATSAKVGLLALASQLTPAKIILAAALVGGGTGVTYGVVTPSPPATQEAPHGALEKAPVPPAGLAMQDPVSRDVATRPPPLEETTEKESPEIELPTQAKLTPVKKSSAGSNHIRSGSGSSGATLSPVTVVATPAPSSFNDELTSLRKAQNALRSGDAQTAWQLMVRLDQERPTGALIPERRMTKVLALCALGKGEQAQSVARTVLSSSSGPMYRSRIENSCAKTVALSPTTAPAASRSSTASFPDGLK